MKALVWGLNIVQFLVVYLFAFALFRYGIFELLPPETGLTARGVWPAASIGIAFLPWKFYNRFSNYLITFFKSTDIPKANISNMSKPWPSKLLYTFFFGYAALKWRRLIRTLLLLLLCSPMLLLGAPLMVNTTSSYDLVIYRTIVFFSPLTGALFLIALISWLIKPFIVKEE